MLRNFTPFTIVVLCFVSVFLVKLRWFTALCTFFVSQRDCSILKSLSVVIKIYKLCNGVDRRFVTHSWLQNRFCFKNACVVHPSFTR